MNSARDVLDYIAFGEWLTRLEQSGRALAVIEERAPRSVADLMCAVAMPNMMFQLMREPSAVRGMSLWIEHDLAGPIRRLAGLV